MGFNDYYNIVLLIGGALTLLMSTYLCVFSQRFFANKVLAVLTLLWAVHIFLFVLQSRDFYLRFPHLYGIATGLSFLLFPLLYMYIRSYLYEDTRYIKKYLLHFIPILIYSIALSPFYFQTGDEKLNCIQNGMPQWVTYILLFSDLIIIIQGVAYTLMSLHMLQHFWYFRGKSLSEEQKSSLTWLKQFVIINIVLWAIGSSAAFIEITNVGIPFDLFKVFYLGLSVLAVWIGAFAIMNPHFFSVHENVLSIIKKKPVVNKESAEEKEQAIKTIFLFLETNKPYLKSNFSLQDLVEGTGIYRNRISDLLNNELNQSFYDIINDLRTKEATRLINEGLHKQHTISYVAAEAGFNSKATFNRIFKKNTGFTPTEYIAQTNKIVLSDSTE